MLMVVAILVLIPLGGYYLNHLTDFFDSTSLVSIVSVSDLALFWPVGMLFLIGFVRSIVKLFRHKKKHGYHPTVQVLMLSWFFLGVISGADVMVLPLLMIFAGEGLWWLYNYMKKWSHPHETHPIATFAIVLFLFAIMLNEYHAYILSLLAK